MQISLAFNTAQNLAGKHIFPENTQWTQYVKGCYEVTCVFITHISVCACMYIFAQGECMHIDDYKRHPHLKMCSSSYFE